MPESKYEKGMQVRREVLGDAHVDRSLANSDTFDQKFQELIIEFAWGTVWSGPDLDRKTRHLITIAILAALGREQELALHLRATRNTGVTREEIREAMHHVAVYAGVPAANSAISLAKQIFKEMETP